jgi:2'-phosphotransferase
MPDKRLRKISGKMTQLLRHRAMKDGVHMEPNGMIKITDLLEWIHGQDENLGASLDDVLGIIQADAKVRYRLSEDGNSICANQGHSMMLSVDRSDLGMTDWTQKGFLIHGTFMEWYGSIETTGLSRMKRQHIHMITPYSFNAADTNEIPAGNWHMIRKNINLYVFIDSDKTRHLGIKFLQSYNGVILSEGNEHGLIPTECLTLVPAGRQANCYGFIIKSQESGKVLMVRTRQGYYGFPKGKRKKGENSMACALRELWEETSLTIDHFTEIHPTVHEEINKKGNCPTIYYCAVVGRDLPVKCLDQDEGLDTFWMSMEDISKLNEQEFSSQRRALL